MNIKIPKNHVLLEVDFLRHKKIAFQSGTEIIIDPEFSKEKHANNTGIVVQVPESLYYNNNGTDVMQSMEFNTDIEVKIGDKVFFHYLQINAIIAERKHFERDGKFYAFIRHDSLFCGIRNDEIIMFNGWMLLEPIDLAVDEKSAVVTTLPKDRQKKDPLKGRITHIGGLVKEYFYGKDDTDVGIEVAKGDVVIFLPHSDIPLEYKLHQSLDKKYYRVQRKEVLSIYVN